MPTEPTFESSKRLKLIEKTVFISYRRTSASWALAIYQNLKTHGYDVFFDYEGIASGDFQEIILENIKSRAHFLVVLTPTALDRATDNNDWLRREIETALASRRNIVPLMFEGFDFETPSVAKSLTGSLAPLRRYNALPVVASYFDAAMDRLRLRHLNVTLDSVTHPPLAAAIRVAKRQQMAADYAPPVAERELTAQSWYERGLQLRDVEDKVNCFTEAIRLNPNFKDAYIERGNHLLLRGDFDSAYVDYKTALEIGQGDRHVYVLRPWRISNHAVKSFVERAQLFMASGDAERALTDFNKALFLMKRGCNDDDDAREADVHLLAADISRNLGQISSAIAHYQEYLECGGEVWEGEFARIMTIISGLERKT